MALSKAREKALAKRWKKSKAPSGRFSKLPPGTYQAEITDIKIDSSKKGKYLIKWTLEIKSDKKLKGRKVFKSNDILWEPTPRKKGDMDGLDFFKGDLETIGYDLPELDEKSLKKLLKKLKGTLVEIYIQDNKKNPKYQDCYFNSAINDGDSNEEEEEEDEETEEETDDDDEEEDDEEEEDEEEDDDEEEYEEVEEEKPKKKAKKASKKKAKKKAEPEPEDDDDFDDDDDDEEEWED